MYGSFPIGSRPLAETLASALVLGRVHLTGYAPAVGSMAKVSLPLGHIEITGQSPIVAVDTTVSLILGSIELDGLDPVVALSVSLQLPLGSIEVGGLDPTVRQFTLYSPFISSITGLESMLDRATAEGLNVTPEIEFLNHSYGSYDYLIELADVHAFEGATVTIREVYRRPDGDYYTDLDQARDKRAIEPIYLVTIETPGGSLVLNFSDREVIIPDGAATDTIFKGAIDSLTDVGLDTFTYRLSRLINLSDRRWKQAVLSTEDFPKAVEDVGEHLPIIYGAEIKVPALRATWGARSTLKAEITDAAASIELSDASAFPSAATIIINEERISYSSKSGNTLNGCSRGLDGTTAASHSAAADVIERLAQYVSVLADHELHSVAEIYAEIEGKLYRVDSGVGYYFQGGKALLIASENVQVQTSGDAEVIDPAHDHGSQETAQFTNSTLPNKTSIDNSSSGAGSTSLLFNDVSGARYSVTYKISLELYLRRAVIGIRQLDEQWIHIMVALGSTWYGIYQAYPTTTNGTMQIQVTVPGTAQYDALYGNKVKVYVEATSGAASFAESSYFTITSCDRIVNGETEAAATGIEVTVDTATSSVERFVAVVNGYKDPDGYYGGAGSLIKNPAHIIKHFLVRRLGYSLAKAIDSAAFATAAADLAAYELGFAVRDEITPSKFIAELAWSGGAVVNYKSDKWVIAKVPAAAPAAVKTIDNGDCLDKPGFRFKRLGIFDVINSVAVRYSRAYYVSGSESEWNKTYSYSDAASLAKYGAYHEDVDLKWVRHEGTAQALAQRYILERKLPLWTVEMTLPFSEHDLAPGDTIEITGPLNSGKKFFIQEIYRQDKGSVKVRAIEWYA